MTEERLKNKLILLVEDDEVSQFLFRKMLEDIGIPADFSENGKDAVEKILNNQYDLVLMDIEMPILNGIEATKKIRLYNDPYFQQLPIIGLSANPFDLTKEKFIEQGMTDYLAKPVSEADLIEKLNFYLLND